MDQQEESNHKHKIWNENVENIIKEIQKSCQNYKFIHIKTAKNANLKYDFVMYFVILLGPLSSIIASVYNNNSNCNEENGKIVSIFLYLVSAVLSAIIKFSKFEHTCTVHKSISMKFASLEHNIKRQLTLDRDQRQPAGKYLEWVTQSFDDLFNSSPVMVENIYSEWKQQKEIIEPGSKHEPGSNHEPESKPEAKDDSKHDSEPLPRDKSEIIEYNTFNDGRMKYELARFRNN